MNTVSTVSEHCLNNIYRSLPQLFGSLSTLAVNCALVAKQLISVLPFAKYNRPHHTMGSSCNFTIFLQSILGLDGFTWPLLAAHQGNKHTLRHQWHANPALLRLFFSEVRRVLSGHPVFAWSKLVSLTGPPSPQLLCRIVAHTPTFIEECIFRLKLVQPHWPRFFLQRAQSAKFPCLAASLFLPTCS